MFRIKSFGFELAQKTSTHSNTCTFSRLLWLGIWRFWIKSINQLSYEANLALEELIMIHSGPDQCLLHFMLYLISMMIIIHAYSSILNCRTTSPPPPYPQPTPHSQDTSLCMTPRVTRRVMYSEVSWLRVPTPTLSLTQPTPLPLSHQTYPQYNNLTTLVNNPSLHLNQSHTAYTCTVLYIAIHVQTLSQFISLCH